MVRLLIAACVTFLAVSPAFAQSPKKPPNVVVIMLDDLGYGDIGCFGGKIPTPNIDRMAKEGIRFTNFYVAQAVCSASRAALLTGRYPNRVGIYGALNHNAKHGLGPNERTIADILKLLRYATAIFGKWHLGHFDEHLPNKHGFDEYFGLPYSNDMWPKHPSSKFPPLPLIEGTKVIAENPDQSKLTAQYTAKAVDFIRRNKDQPFFLYVPHTMPHVPLFGSERFKGKSGQGLYADVVMELDDSVGQILSALKECGIDDNTLVIFLSDNGPWLSYGNHGGSAGRLREGKGTTWEGGVRVPFVARWPGKIPADAVCPEPAMTIDLLPTIAKLTGGSLPGHKLDGMDISPLLLGDPKAKSPHDAFYFYWGKHLQAVRAGQWKLYFPRSYVSVASEAGKGGKPGAMKSVQAGLELFDLQKDESETTNVAEQNPQVVRRLQELADVMRKDIGDEPPQAKKK